MTVTVVEIPLDEQIEMMRNGIVALLSHNPHCPVAQLLGQALMDLYEDL